MIELVFESITVEHFRCFSTKQTFQLSPAPGLWFLRGKNEVEPALGSNGSGKSTLFEAFCWCLDGETSKGLKSTEIKPWTGNGTPTVEIRLLKNDQPQTIRRVAKTNGLSINGVEAGPNEVQKLLGMSLQVLLNTNLFAQGASLFLDKKPKEKFELLSEVLPLERWEERSARAGKRTKELEQLLAEMIGEKAGHSASLAQTEALLKRTQEDAAEWEFVREEEAKGRDNDIATYEAEIARLQPNLDKVELAHDAAWIRVREMRKDIKGLQAKVDRAQQACNAWENEQTILERDRDRLALEISKLDDAKTCPTCGQPIKKTNVREHKAELETQLQEILPKIQRFLPDDLANAFDEAQERYATMAVSLQKAERETDEYQSSLRAGHTTMEAHKAALNAIKDARKDERNPYTDQVVALKQQKRKVEREIEELGEDILEAQRQIERVGFWVKGFKDVALYQLEEVLVELEAVANVLLVEVGLVGWQMAFAVERETQKGTVQRGVNVTVTPPYDHSRRGTPIRWESWSGGEGQRLRLVGALALADVLLRHAGVSINLEVFDEPTQHLSGAGVSDLCAYLSTRAKAQGKTIWFIDHQAREGRVFEGTATVTKTAKGSVINAD